MSDREKDRSVETGRSIYDETKIIHDLTKSQRRAPANLEELSVENLDKWKNKKRLRTSSAKEQVSKTEKTAKRRRVRQITPQQREENNARKRIGRAQENKEEKTNRKKQRNEHDRTIRAVRLRQEDRRKVQCSRPVGVQNIHRWQGAIQQDLDIVTKGTFSLLTAAVVVVPISLLCPSLSFSLHLCIKDSSQEWKSGPPLIMKRSQPNIVVVRGK
jgi:hypothetical protein